MSNAATRPLSITTMRSASWMERMRWEMMTFARDAGVEGRADGGIGRRIHRARGVVQHQHLRMLQQGPCDAQALPLAAGDIGTALVDDRVVSVGERLDELIGAGLAASLLTLFQGGVLLAPAEILKDGSGEQGALLQDHRNLVA